MDDKNQTPDNYEFAGFGMPTTTPVPDQLFDELLFVLSPTEMVVLLYIVRRTLGFKKQADNISLKQMETGIVTRDGRVLDRGTGLSKATIARALKGLVAKKVIFKSRRQNSERGFLPSTYRLNIVGQNPLSQNETSLVSERGKPISQDETSLVSEGDKPLPQEETSLVSERDIQETEKQETEEQNTVRQHQQDDVVAALTEFGLDQSSIRSIVRARPEEYITEKIANVRWLIETDPDAVKNPPGFLRKAIEDDWPAPPGYTATQTEEPAPDCDICGGADWIPVGSVQVHCFHRDEESPLADLPPESG